MSKLRIRELNPDDWHLYREIRLNSLKDSPDSFGSTYAQEADFPDEEWRSRLAPSFRSQQALPLIAETDGRVMGIAWGLIHEPDFKVAHVYQMWVSPDHRGKGIAKSLLDEIRVWAGAKDCDLLALSVSTNSGEAVGLYSSAGFVPKGLPEELRPGSTLMVQPMVLELHSAA